MKLRQEIIDLYTQEFTKKDKVYQEMNDVIELNWKNLQYESQAIKTSSEVFVLQCAKLLTDISSLNK